MLTSMLTIKVTLQEFWPLQLPGTGHVNGYGDKHPLHYFLHLCLPCITYCSGLLCTSYLYKLSLETFFKLHLLWSQNKSCNGIL